jgi:DNA polymerase elongation subunit (family B)
MINENQTNIEISSSDIDRILYGANPLNGVVGIGSSRTVYIRQGAAVEKRPIPCHYLFLLSDKRYADGIGCAEYRTFAGSGHFRHAFYFSTFPSFLNARGMAVENYNRINGASFNTNETYRIPDLLIIPDIETQFLMQSGISQFRGMEFFDLRRMRIAMSVSMPWESRHTTTSNPENKILCIALSDSTGWRQIMHSGQMNEEQMISEAVKSVSDRDPDVIEGHGLFNLALPLLEAKCRKHKCDLKFGRDSKFVRKYETSRTVAGRKIPFTNYLIPGRHIVDTLMLAEKAGLVGPDTDELDACAVANDVADKAEFAVGGTWRAACEWDADRDCIVEKTVAQLDAVSRISDILLPAEFYHAKMVPIPLGKLCFSGQAKKIELMMLREYMRRGQAVPKPPPPQPFEGGYNEIFVTGKCDDVAKVDVTSQYPSIMTGEKIAPESDTLGIFLPMIDKMMEMRSEAKSQRDAAPVENRIRYDNIQKSLKILVNSAYGMLGHQYSHFADFDAAARITARGREIMKKIIPSLQNNGCAPIQCDTDGCHFSVTDEIKENPSIGLLQLRDALKRELPGYMEIDVDGLWPSMLSLRKKNYALLDAYANVSITGGLMGNRGDVKFIRDILKTAAESVLTNNLQRLHDRVLELRKAVAEYRLPLSEFVMRETITMSGKEYRKTIKGGAGKRPIYEKMLLFKEGRVFLIGGTVGYYHTISNHAGDDTGVEFDFRYSPECNGLDTGHYLQKLDRALQRLQPLFTPEQYRLLFNTPSSEITRRMSGRMSVGSASAAGISSGTLNRYVELSKGFKSKKGIKRHVFIPADDADALHEFREKHSDTDVYASTFQYLCDRLPDKNVTRFCPKSGDFIIELEDETGDQSENIENALAAARRCVETIESALKIPRSAITPYFNGNKSVYLSIPQNALGIPDCVELNLIYERLVRHIAGHMPEEYRDAVDMNLYNHDRPLRILGSTHPRTGLHNTRLSAAELFSLDAAGVIELAKYRRDNFNLIPVDFDCAETRVIVAEITSDIPHTVNFDSSRKAPRVNMEKSSWRKNIADYLRLKGVSVRIPCVEAISAVIHSGGSIWFTGRAKLITELNAVGASEADIIRIFMDSPFFTQKYFGDTVLADTRPEAERNDTGFMLREDLWNDYKSISCAKCQEWCDPGKCYRNLKISFFNEKDSLSFKEFRDKSRDVLKSSLDKIIHPDPEAPVSLKLNLIEAPMASGKTYQTMAAATDLAASDRRSLILAPDHSTCSEAVGMAKGMNMPPGKLLVHVTGKNEKSCVNYAEMLRPCGSCRCGAKTFTTKHPDLLDEIVARESGVFSLERMKSTVADINHKQKAETVCLRTLSMLLAPKAHIVVAPFIFFIDENLQKVLEPLPNHIFVDEADLFADQLMEFCRRSLTVALPRTSNAGCMKYCRKPRCGQCRLSYSTRFSNGDMEPRYREPINTPAGGPADFINALRDAVNTVREETARNVIRKDIFDLDAVEENIHRLEQILKPADFYKKPKEKSITVEQHVRRENEHLCAAGVDDIHGVINTGVIFGYQDEITKYPAINFIKVLVKPDEIQYDEEPPGDDAFDRFRFSVPGIYSSNDDYQYYRNGDSVYKNSINVFLLFLEFCENAPNNGALLRHVPRNDETENACRIVLSYLDKEQFENIVGLLQFQVNVLLSGTFIEPSMAAAVFLLDEKGIAYYGTTVGMHNLATLVLHNNCMGEVLLSGNKRDNPLKPKALNHDSFFKFFNYCIDMSDDDLNLYYFAKNKNMAKSLFDSYKRNAGRMKFKARLLDSDDNVVHYSGDEVLLHPNAPAETRLHLERASCMFMDNYRSSRARGKNLPDFHLSIADGNGRANFDHFFDYVAAINSSTNIGITMRDLLGYNRNRAVCQAMLRTPRDEQEKHLIIYNGDMTVFDTPKYLRNRIMEAKDLYEEYIKGTRKKIYNTVADKYGPESNEELQMLLLAAYFTEMMGNADAEVVEAAEGQMKEDALFGTDDYLSFADAARISPAFSETIVREIYAILSKKGFVTHNDRVGRKAKWFVLLDNLVDAGLLRKEKRARKAIFFCSEPDSEPFLEISEGK